MSLRVFIRLGVLGALAFSAFIACSNEPILLSNDVNLTPLLDVPLPVYIEDLSEVMDTSLLGDHHRFDHTNSLRDEGEWMETWQYSGFEKQIGHTGTVRITLILFSSTTDTENYFSTSCGFRSMYRNDTQTGIDGSSQLYISYLEEQRAGPEGFNKPLGVYSSCIAIQRSNLFIQIFENTHSLDRDPINEVIEELAEAFYEKLD